MPVFILKLNCLFAYSISQKSGLRWLNLGQMSKANAAANVSDK